MSQFDFEGEIRWHAHGRSEIRAVPVRHVLNAEDAWLVSNPDCGRRMRARIAITDPDGRQCSVLLEIAQFYINFPTVLPHESLECAEFRDFEHDLSRFAAQRPIASAAVEWAAGSVPEALRSRVPHLPKP